MDLSLYSTSMGLKEGGTRGTPPMLYATIRAFGSLPSVALSSPMAAVLYPFMRVP